MERSFPSPRDVPHIPASLFHRRGAKPQNELFQMRIQSEASQRVGFLSPLFKKEVAATVIISAVRISAQASLSQAQAGQAVQIERRKFHFYMSLSDLPRMAMPKQKSRAASQSKEMN
ncbi:hypothetical protein Lal_00002024 [Lupinus albus]|nr:hypothetical protein Lal_00002024 [Lupinus albus]